MSNVIQFTPNTGEMTMSSREIAELTEKQHKNVLRDIRSMLGELKIDGLRFERVYLDAKGEERKEYRLPKNLTMTLVTGYRADLRLRVVDRMLELEQERQFDPTKLTRTQILQLAIESEEQVREQAEQIAELLPKAEGLDRIATATGSHCFTDVAKLLDIRPMELFELLRKNNWIYRRSHKGRFVAYQKRIKQGLLEHKVREIELPDGSPKVVGQCRVTPKGLARLAELTA